MTTTGATGPSPTEGNNFPAVIQTDLEQQESQRQVARRNARLYGPPPKNDDTPDRILLPLGETTAADIVLPNTFTPPQPEWVNCQIPSAARSLTSKGAPKVVPASNVLGDLAPTEQLSARKPVPNTNQAKQCGKEAGVQLATANDDAAKFISRVVPWPKNDQAPGYINLHWTMAGHDGKTFWTGKPCRSVVEFISGMNWAKSLPTTRDIYFCLSLQERTRTSARGKTTVARSQDDALALQSLWLDIDVKEPPKGYATIEEAWVALKDFCTLLGLPRPNVAVASGGGLHVYWTSKKTLTPDQWRPLASALKDAALKRGLRCDAGCTANSAQILRVPGTWNCKNGLRRPVQLLWVREDYDF